MNSQIPERLPTSINDQGVKALFSFAADIMIQIEMVFEEHLDQMRLRRAMDLVLDAEPVLGCKLCEDESTPYWRRLLTEDRANLQIFERETDYRNFKALTLDVSVGPGLIAGLFVSDNGDRLLLKIAHEMADAGGAKDAAYRLAEIYRELNANPDYRPVPNVAGDRTPHQILKRVPWYSFVCIFWNYIKEVVSENVPGKSFVPFVGTCDLSSRQYVELKFTADRSARIKKEAKSFGGTINDIMLAAFIRASTRSGWDGKRCLRIRFTVDLRRWYLPDGRAGGIANLTGLELCVLGKKPGDNLAETVRRVAAFTAKRKESWFGLNMYTLPILIGRILPFSSFKSFATGMMKMAVEKEKIYPMFTNLGEIDVDLLAFDASPINCWGIVPATYPPFVGAGLSGYGQQLTFTLSSFCTTRAHLEKLAQDVDAELP